VYHPFPHSNAVWNYEYMLICLGWGGIENDSYSYIFSGDTIVGLQSYQKLFIPAVNVISNTCGNGSTVDITAGYKGAIRQDTSNKQIFFLPPSDSVEQLLYDFNMQVGDTVKGYIESYAFQKDIVQSIDSVLVGSSYRKRWQINPWYGIQFIEGIGSTYGLIEKSPGNIIDAPDYSLTCFSQDGQTLYPDTSSSCDLIDAIVDKEIESSRPTISPNPFQSNATLLMNVGFEAKNLMLKICNSLGVIVRTENIPSFPFILEKKSLANGIYFYKVQNDDMITVGNGKFILY